MDDKHYCEFDHDLDEPCGRPATIRCHGMWFCAEHYDRHTEFMAEIGLGPDDYAPGANEEGK